MRVSRKSRVFNSITTHPIRKEFAKDLDHGQGLVNQKSLKLFLSVLPLLYVEMGIAKDGLQSWVLERENPCN